MCGPTASAAGWNTPRSLPRVTLTFAAVSPSSVSTLTLIFNVRSWPSSAKVILTDAPSDSSPSSSSDLNSVAPITAVGSEVVTPVMSGPPPAVAPITKETSVITPLANTSPDQLPGPLMSARVPPRTATLWRSSRPRTDTSAVPSALTNATLLGFTCVAVQPSAGFTDTLVSAPSAPVLTSTVSGTPNSGSVVIVGSAIAGAALTADAATPAATSSAVLAAASTPPRIFIRCISVLPDVLPAGYDEPTHARTGPRWHSQLWHRFIGVRPRPVEIATEA